MDAYTSPATKPLFRSAQIVQYVVGLLEIVLAFRFILKLTGANAAAGFTSFIYGISWPLAAPFLNVFRITKVEGSIFEWTTLLAMVVYELLALLLVRLFVMSKPVTTPQAAAKLDRKEEKDGAGGL